MRTITFPKSLLQITCVIALSGYTFTALDDSPSRYLLVKAQTIMVMPSIIGIEMLNSYFCPLFTNKKTSLMWLKSCQTSF